MIHRFTTNRVQVWQLVGLSCWHRTLIQQQVEWISRSSASSAPPYPSVQWLWSDSLFEDFGSSKSPEIDPDWDVIILSLDLVKPPLNTEPAPGVANREQMVRTKPNNWLIGNRIRSDQVGVLWDWTSQGGSSLSLASMLGLSGVISDPMSLRHWLQVFMTRVAARMQPAHPFLQNVTIPSLSASEL